MFGPRHILLRDAEDGIPGEVGYRVACGRKKYLVAIAIVGIGGTGTPCEYGGGFLYLEGSGYHPVVAGACLPVP